MILVDVLVVIPLPIHGLRNLLTLIVLMTTFFLEIL